MGWALLLLWLATAKAGWCAGLNIAFHNGATTGGAMAPEAAPTTAGSVVDTARDYWNNVINTGGVGLTNSGFVLRDAGGVDAGATLHFKAGFSGYNTNGWAGKDKDYVMMEGWYGFRAGEFLAISNLPPALTANGYKVIIYGDANNARTMNYYIGSETRAIVDGTSNFSGNMAPFSAVFTGLTNADLVITGNPNASDSRSAINGLQIVPLAAPPPVIPGLLGVNFHYSATGALAAQEVAGVLPMSGWNNLDVGNFGNFTNYPFGETPLTLADGTPTSARVNISLVSGYNGNVRCGNATGDRTLMSEYISWDPVDGSGPEDPGQLRVEGLGPEFTTNGYDVLVYFDSDNANRTFTVRIGDVSFVGADNAAFADVYTLAADGGPANYAWFRGLTNSSFSLEMDSDTGRAAVNALQILPRASAPPSLAITAFRASPSRVAPGGGAHLMWQVMDATSLRLDPGGGEVGSFTTNGLGGLTVHPAVSTTYTLIASNAQLGVSTSAVATVFVGPPAPNLLLFLVDDMGWQDTSVPFHYAGGAPVTNSLNLRYRTPAMETLASRGMKFTAAYAAPVCTPTRTAIMTGKNTARHRVTNWTTPTGVEPGGSNTADLRPPSEWRRTGIAANEVTLPRLLADHGYRTIHVGKGHLGSAGSFGQWPQNLGFQVNIAGSEIGHPASYLGTQNFGTGTHHVPNLSSYHGQDIFLTEALTLEMAKQLELCANESTPFFAYLAHYAVHSPFTVDQRFAANYPGLTGSALAFATMIEGMDKSLGDLLDKLEALGVAESTLVVFLSDNGGDLVNTPLRNKKGTLYEGGVRVPLIISWARPNPANPIQSALPIAPGSVCHQSVLAWDLFPTLLNLAGAAWSHAVDGQDLRGYLMGLPGEHRPQRFAIHFPHHRDNGAASQNPGTIWRDGEWKLIYDYQTGAAELFNLAEDLTETNNVAAAQPERVMAMSRAMARELNGLGALFPEYLTNGAPRPPLMPALPAMDLDGDGIPDLQEDTNADGLVSSGETDPDLADSDGDGTPDGAEYRTGTDPLNPASRFALSLERSNHQFDRLSWPGKSGALYRLEARVSLASGAWQLIADDIPGQDGTTSYGPLNWGVNQDARFYRLLLK